MGQLICLVTIGLAVFLNSVHSPFVFDDIPSIADNPHIRQLWPLSQSMAAPPQGAFAGRPIVSLTVAVNYALGGLSPIGYHLWNLLVHVVVAVLFWALLGVTLRDGRRFRANRTLTMWLPFVCALAWLVHPLNTEVVNYITQRSESMMAACYLLTLYASARLMAATRQSVAWMLVAIAACAVGMATKESMATAPVVVLLYDAAYFSGSIRSALRKRPALYLLLVSTWLLLAYLIAPGPRSRSAGFATQVGVWEYLANQAVMVVTYLRLAVWPHPLVLDYGPAGPVGWISILTNGSVVIALLAIAAWAWRRHVTAGFLAVFFFITLAPSSSVIPIATEVGAERRMYLPLMAVVILAVLAASALLARIVGHARSARQVASATVVVVTVGALGCASARRNGEYHNAVGIWQTSLDRRPTGRAHYSIGIVLEREGRDREAEEHFRTALQAGYPQAHYPLGELLYRHALYPEALEQLSEYVRVRPEDVDVPRASVLSGMAALRLGSAARAVDELNRALTMLPGDLDALGSLADALLADRQFGAASDRYASYLAKAPGNAAAHNNRGLALAHQGRYGEAVDEFMAAARLKPADVDIRRNLAYACLCGGRLSDAEREYRQAMVMAPSDVGLVVGFARTLMATGRDYEARDQIQRALTAHPDDAELRSLDAALARKWVR